MIERKKERKKQTNESGGLKVGIANIHQWFPEVWTV